MLAYLTAFGIGLLLGALAAGGGFIYWVVSDPAMKQLAKEERDKWTKEKQDKR